jgi:hypothetical protein
MKKILIACILFGAFTTLKAQSFTVSTTLVNFAGNVSSTDIVSPYWMPVIHNTSGDTLQLSWNRVEENIPGWWRSSVCTEYYCYSMPDDSATWILLPGDSDMIYVHIYPYGYADTGNVVIRLYDPAVPADSIRVTFNCNVPVGIQEYELISYFRTDFTMMSVIYSVKESCGFSLTDVQGRVVDAGKVIAGAEQRAAVQEHGVYILTLITSDGRKSVRRFVL